jgi:outer membrane protein assembly factor BamE
MQKLLICCTISASLLTAGCGTVDTVKGWGTVVGDAIPSIFNGMPLMYRQDIQQGNIVTQEMINKLRPGMARRQVQYIMGTPILVDVFHQDRWDYYYSMKKGGEAAVRERISLYFKDNKLTKIEGDFRPTPTSDTLEAKKEVVVQVPDYEAEEKGFFDRALEKIGLIADDD